MLDMFLHLDRSQSKDENRSMRKTFYYDRHCALNQWDPYFPLNSVPDQGHYLLSPGFLMNKFLARQLAFITCMSHLTLNEVHFMAEVCVKRIANNPNKIEY